MAAVIPILMGVAAAIMTMAGGLFALRSQHRLVWLLSISAGIVLGVAVFDLLPEAIMLGPPTNSVRTIMCALAASFCVYLLLDRWLSTARRDLTGRRHHLAPAVLALHSLIDGLGIGLAFQIDPATGWLVAVAVLAHDFADGVNTVGLCLTAQAPAAARGWLALNSLMPVAGVLIGQQLQLAPGTLALLLGGFAGCFLYIAACELIPKSFAIDHRLRTSIMNVAGLLIMAIVTALVR